MLRQKQQETSFRTNRTFTSYNINDYLPSSNQISSKIIFPYNNRKDKICTQPNDNTQKQNNYQVNQLNRKNELLQEEKGLLKKEIERLRNTLNQKNKIIQRSEEELLMIVDSNNKNMRMMEQMKNKKNKMVIQKNNINFVNFPKYKQLYQVSVQTEQTIQSIVSQSKQDNKIQKMQSSNQDLQTIYQKLQNLKIPKRNNKQIVSKSHIFMNNKSTNFTKGNITSWRNSQQKQNEMKIANIMGEKPSLNRKQKQKYKKYEQTLQLWAIETNQMQHMINLYLQSY